MIKILKKIKYYLEGRIFKTPELKINKEWFGNQYGGFFVHPNNLNHESIVYSLGIGTDISFDKSIINRFNCKIYAFDPTPKSIDWVKKNVKEDNFKMHNFGISDKTENRIFYLPKNDDYVSGSIKKIKTVDHNKHIDLNFKSVKEVMKQNGHNSINLLKMDIEGSEYDVLENILEEKIHIDQLVVEFHPHLIKKGKKLTAEIFNKMNEKGFKCFAISQSYSEFSFIKI